MADEPFQRLWRFLSELKRGKVYWIPATDLVVAFLFVRVETACPRVGVRDFFS